MILVEKKGLGYQNSQVFQRTYKDQIYLKSQCKHSNSVEPDCFLKIETISLKALLI